METPALTASCYPTLPGRPLSSLLLAQPLSQLLSLSLLLGWSWGGDNGDNKNTRACAGLTRYHHPSQGIQREEKKSSGRGSWSGLVFFPPPPP